MQAQEVPAGVQEELPGGPHGWVPPQAHPHLQPVCSVGSDCMWTCVAGKLCIEVTPQSKIVWISESLCIGCGICIKVLFTLINQAWLDLKSRFKLILVPFLHPRNVHSERCPLLICPATWRRKPHTDTAPIPLNCTGTMILRTAARCTEPSVLEQCFIMWLCAGCLSPGLVRCSDWWGPTVSASPQLWRS